MQRTLNHLDELYSCEMCLLIDVIIKDQFRKQSIAEIEKLNREKNPETKKKEGTSKPSPKEACFVIK